MNSKKSNNIAVFTQSLKLNFEAKKELGKHLLFHKNGKIQRLFYEILRILLLLVLTIAVVGGAFILWYGANYNDYIEASVLVIMFLSMLLLDFFFLRPQY